MVTLNFDKDTCKNVADFLELYFFQNIRDDECIDNIEYVRSLINAIDELNRVSNWYKILIIYLYIITFI